MITFSPLADGSKTILNINNVPVLELTQNSINLLKPLSFGETGIILESAYKDANRNKLINGDFRINQYNQVGANAVDLGILLPQATAYFIDRWVYNASVASKINLQRVTDAPVGSRYSLKATVAAQYAPAAADLFYVAQRIEGINILDLQWGSASALYITTSFKVKASVPGVYSGTIGNSDGTRTYPFTYTITQANVWTPLTLVIQGCLDGTWLTNTMVGLTLAFTLGAGANFTTPNVGQWNAGAFFKGSTAIDFTGQAVNSTWQLADVQLERGKISLPQLDRKEDSIEKIRCQRYMFRKSYTNNLTGPIATLHAYATTGAQGKLFDLPVEMRAIPTPAVSSAADFSMYNASANTLYQCNAFNFGTQPSANEVCVQGGITTASAVLTTGGATDLSPVATTAWIGASAEL